MPKISFVYFDVGGVLIRDFSDSDKWSKMLHDMGFKDADVPAFDIIYDEFEKQVCEGKYHVDELVPRIVKEFNLSISPDFSMQKYFVEHFDKNVELWALIKKLAKTTKVGLLTGQYPGLLNDIRAAGLFDFDNWSAVIDTSIEGINKPDPRIYRIAEARTELPAKEILFVDNREKNLIPARELGWQTFLYDSRDYRRASSDLSKFLGL